MTDFYQGQVFNGLAPKQGPKMLGQVLDFSAVSEIDIDLFEQIVTGQIDYIQTIYVNNTDNNNAIQFEFEGTRQVLNVPANASGNFPVFVSGNSVRVKVTTPAVADLEIPIIWLNVPMPLTQWGPVNVTANVSTAVQAGAATLVSDNTTAGTSAALLAANAAAIRRVVQNPPTNAESIFINFGGVAASALTLALAPGQSFDTGSGPIDRTAWTVFSVNAVPFTTLEMV